MKLLHPHLHKHHESPAGEVSSASSVEEDHRDHEMDHLEGEDADGEATKKLFQLPPALLLVWDLSVDFFTENVLLLFALFLPVLYLLGSIFGHFFLWVTLLILSIYYALQRLIVRREKFLKFLETNISQVDHKSESCEWLNMVVQKFFVTSLPKFLENILNEKVHQKFSVNEHNKIEVRIESILGNNSPFIKSINCRKDKADKFYESDFQVNLYSDAVITVRIKFKTFSFNVKLSNLCFVGKMRLKFTFDKYDPKQSVGKIAFLEIPIIHFALIINNFFDINSIPFIEKQVQGHIERALEDANLIWPKKTEFYFGGSKIIKDFELNQPITDLSFSHSQRIRGTDFHVATKTVSMQFDADLNSGTGAGSLYLCYSRNKKKKPITGFCVISLDNIDKNTPDFPQHARQLLPGPDFELVKGLDDEYVNLNADNDGIPLFVGITRAEGPPITGISIINFSESEELDEESASVSLVMVTPQGKLANLNRKASKGHEIYFAYRGGSPSVFGYNKPRVSSMESGTLVIRAIKGIYLKDADPGGTSDPYISFCIAGPFSKVKGLLSKSTSIIDNTLDPEWNEALTLPASSDDYLHATVFDHDAVGTDDKLGVAVIPLKNLPIGKEVVRTFKLQQVERGEILLGLTAADFGDDLETDIANVKLEPVDLSGKKKSSSSRTPTKTKEELNLDEKIDDQTRYIDKEGQLKEIVKMSIGSIVGKLENKKRWIVLKGYRLFIYKDEKDIKGHEINLRYMQIEYNQAKSIIDVKGHIKLQASSAESDKWFYAMKRNSDIAIWRDKNGLSMEFRVAATNPSSPSHPSH